MVVDVPQLVPDARPSPPDGPYVVAGLGRAGRAATEALLGTGSREPPRVWDPGSRPETAAVREELAQMGAVVAVGGDGRELLDLRPEPRCLVKSPGMPFDTTLVAAAFERGLTVVDEAELGWRLDGRPFVGITGTNGKGTSAAIVCAALTAAGLRPLLAGNTHFGPPLSAALRVPADVIVAELSGGQLRGSPELLPEASLFTNLGQQHWDYHGSREATAEAKRRMFVRGGRAARVASVNLDDRVGRRFAAEVEERGGRVAGFGKSAAAEHRLVGCEWSIDSGLVRLETPDGTLELETRQPGGHNAINLAGALALVDAIGLGSPATRLAAAEARLPPGRWEAVDEGQPFSLVVDFAHNPEGIAAVLSTARRLAPARSGGRVRAVSAPLPLHDPDMRLAAVRTLRECADDVVITTQRWNRDDPLSPPPDVVDAAKEPEGCPCTIVNRRAAAIRLAISRARPGDVVMILGRGVLPFPLYDGTEDARPFDDREVAAEAARRWSESSVSATRPAG